MSLSSLSLDQSGDFDLLYNFFCTRNYKFEETKNGFALPFTPMHFIPNMEDGIEDFVSNKRIVWDFGDSTTSEAITASHAYSKPGSYKVTCYLYDKNGEGYYDTFHSDVNISDFIQDTLTISVTGDDSDHYLSGGNLYYPTGNIASAITVNRYNSFRALEDKLPTIVPYASAAGPDHDYFAQGYDKLTYGHLYPSSTFVQIITSNGTIETLPVNAVQTIDTNIYIKLSGNEIVYTSVTDPDAFFAGLSGYGEVYFKSDFADRYNLILGYKQGDIFEYANTTNYGLSAEIYSNNTYRELSFSSNGIDGEGSDVTTVFDLGSEKFAGTKIAFVVNVKDEARFNQRNMPLLSSAVGGYDFDVILTDGVTEYDIEVTPYFQSLSSLLSGGFFKGYFVSNNNTTLDNVFLSGRTIVDGSYQVRGLSNTFTINPSSYFDIAKQNEDIDFEESFKEIAIQPLFSDARVLMKDFIGSIFGDLSSSQDSVGKATYEKIQNFFDNNTDIDTCNIDQLNGLLQMLSLPELNKYSLPPKLSRLVNLLSISKSKLFGARNRDQTTYQSYGYKNNAFYGYNLGERLTNSSIVVAGSNIVANELYSGKYVTLNTSLPISATNSPTMSSTDGFIYSTDTGSLLSADTYPLQNVATVDVCGNALSGVSLSASSQFYSLSDYNSTWGWNLLSGGGRDIMDIYSFYYQNSSLGPIEDSIINFNDPNNTLSHALTSYTNWSKDNGIMSNIFANSLYEGLDLFNNE